MGAEPQGDIVCVEKSVDGKCAKYVRGKGASKKVNQQSRCKSLRVKASNSVDF